MINTHTDGKQGAACTRPLARSISAVEGRSGWSPGQDRSRWTGGQPPGTEFVGLGHWLRDAGGNRVNGCTRSHHSGERETFRVFS